MQQRRAMAVTVNVDSAESAKTSDQCLQAAGCGLYETLHKNGHYFRAIYRQLIATSLGTRMRPTFNEENQNKFLPTSLFTHTVLWIKRLLFSQQTSKCHFQCAVTVQSYLYHLQN